jgi:hypothetical protein
MRLLPAHFLRPLRDPCRLERPTHRGMRLRTDSREPGLPPEEPRDDSAKQPHALGRVALGKDGSLPCQLVVGRERERHPR